MQSMGVECCYILKLLRKKGSFSISIQVIQVLHSPSNLCNVNISVGDIFTIQLTACLDCIGVASRSLFDLKGLFDSGIYIIL